MTLAATDTVAIKKLMDAWAKTFQSRAIRVHDVFKIINKKDKSGNYMSPSLRNAIIYILQDVNQSNNALRFGIFMRSLKMHVYYGKVFITEGSGNSLKWKLVLPNKEPLDGTRVVWKDDIPL